MSAEIMEPIEQFGEAPTGKKCPTCGVPGMTLMWRAADAGASSPLNMLAWFPMNPVREAKLLCSSVGCAGVAVYGLLVAGGKDAQGRVVGEFLLRDPRETAVW